MEYSIRGSNARIWRCFEAGVMLTFLFSHLYISHISPYTQPSALGRRMLIDFNAKLLILLYGTISLTNQFG